MRLTKDMRDFDALLKRNGYKISRSKGSHFIYTNGNKTVSVNKDLNKMVKRRLIKENCLTI